ncbi:formate dehydrogenase [Hydrogenophaga intermedia]|nr:formate dehydrogenase [Hydrogenophaga intermedia]TMU78079.1 formate dehydrogenase [Hydrogenophaga intermedia]
MKESSRSGPAEGRSRLSRRTLFAGAGTVGAVAAVASVMPGASSAPETAAAEPKPAPERGGGYTLSEHVQHYYRTTRI